MAVHLITGGAGFIGSHLADLLVDGNRVLIADDLSAGRTEFLEKGLASKAVTLIKTDIATENGWKAVHCAVKDTGPLQRIWHLAANSDIPAGVKDANVDFRKTFLTTFLAIEFAKSLLHEMIPALWASTISVRTMRGLQSDSSRNRFSRRCRQMP